MTHAKDLYTITEAMALTGMSRGAVQGAIKTGRLKIETTAGETQRLITRKSLEAWNPDPGQRGRKKT